MILNDSLLGLTATVLVNCVDFALLDRFCQLVPNIVQDSDFVQHSLWVPNFWILAWAWILA